MTILKCKPIVTAVSAVQYTGDNADEVAAFAGIANHKEVGLYRHFASGAATVEKGRYVVKIGADYHLLRENEFEARFEVEGGEEAPAKPEAPTKKAAKAADPAPTKASDAPAEAPAKDGE